MPGWGILFLCWAISTRRTKFMPGRSKSCTAKQMRAYAWLEMQRGRMSFQRGRQDRALASYERANAAYSGYWLMSKASRS